jgi:hypothetical protein
MSTRELPRSVKIILIIIVIVIILVPTTLYFLVWAPPRISALEAIALADKVAEKRHIQYPLVHVTIESRGGHLVDLDKNGKSCCWDVCYTGRNESIGGRTTYGISVSKYSASVMGPINDYGAVWTPHPLEGNVMDSGQAYDILSNNDTLQSCIYDNRYRINFHLHYFCLVWATYSRTSGLGYHYIKDYTGPIWIIGWEYEDLQHNSEEYYGAIDAINGTWVYNPP